MKLKDEITESAILIMKQLMLQDAILIDETFWREKEDILTGLANQLTALCNAYKLEQTKHAYLPAEYLSFCYLRSSILTESNDILINLYDEDLYLGKHTSVSWKPDFIMDKFTESKMTLEKKLYQYNPSIKSYEIKEYQDMLGYQYFYYIFKFLENNMDWIASLDCVKELEKTVNFKVTFGGLYEKQTTLFEIKEEERQEG